MKNLLVAAEDNESACLSFFSISLWFIQLSMLLISFSTRNSLGQNLIEMNVNEFCVIV